ncbi:hypothetical protein PACTADRAFT_52122 [Pachysolen tannophilus NRRL Y-2460]|uniref:NmrA-like domain-containing protein n=1 Tax=Pachysolen tannophilus NRRL Y-2460 TaxID=669874 RepID=A0A1E4TPF6_PACTA|nr:hypothetical protein PACTADRAFT_52122 [Pachysolen tannophilus NRRL Y-2460]
MSSSDKKAVAVVGLNGELGKPTLLALTSPQFKEYYKFPIRAITTSNNKFDEFSDSEVSYHKVDYSDESSLVSAFNGVDVVIDLGTRGNTESLIAAAAKAGVKLFFPTVYTPNYGPEKNDYPNLLGFKNVFHDDRLKCVHLKVGWFADWVICKPPVLFLSLEPNHAVRVGDGNIEIPVTFVSDIGKSLASLAHHPPAQLPEKVCIQGDAYTQNELFKLYEQVKGVKLIVEERSHDTQSQIAAEADKKQNINIIDFMNVVTATMTSPKRNYIDYNKGEGAKLVNPGIFEWKKIVPEAKKAWSKEK